MRNSLIAFGFGALVVVSVMGWTQQATAVPPLGYNLYDANDVYLGQVLGVVNLRGTDLSGVYTVYHPDLNGVLQFNESFATGSYFDNVPSAILYAQPDCQGTAYIQPREYLRPWIVIDSLSHDAYKIASTSIVIDMAQSYSQGSSCFTVLTENAEVYKLNPVTLPFDVDAVRPPYKIRD